MVACVFFPLQIAKFHIAIQDLVLSTMKHRSNITTQKYSCEVSKLFLVIIKKKSASISALPCSYRLLKVSSSNRARRKKGEKKAMSQICVPEQRTNFKARALFF